MTAETAIQMVETAVTAETAIQMAETENEETGTVENETETVENETVENETEETEKGRGSPCRQMAMQMAWVHTSLCGRACPDIAGSVPFRLAWR